MKLLFIYSLLFSPLLPGSESLLEEIRDPECFLNDPLAFSKLVGRFINDDGLQKKVEFEQSLDDWTDSVFKNLVPGGGFVADLKDKLNELYRTGGIPKKLTTQDIINQVEQEGTRNRKMILDLQNTINMQGFEDIVRDINLFESSVARAFNSSFNNQTMAKQLFASTDGKLIPMADSLKLMVTGDTNNIMQLSMDKDDLCTNKTLLDTESSVLNLLSRLNFVAFIVASLKEGRIPVAEHGIDPIASVLNETRIAAEKYIKEFKDLVVKHLNFTVIWSQTPIPYHEHARVMQLMEKKMEGKADLKCEFDALHFLETWERLAYVALNNGRCDTVIRNTHPSASFRMDLQYKSISGKAFSYWEFARRLHPSGVTMDVVMVLKCVPILKDGKLNQYCGF